VLRQRQREAASDPAAQGLRPDLGKQLRCVVSWARKVVSSGPHEQCSPQWSLANRGRPGLSLMRARGGCWRRGRSRRRAVFFRSVGSFVAPNASRRMRFRRGQPQATPLFALRPRMMPRAPCAWTEELH
jgi:hypothetical protein